MSTCKIHNVKFYKPKPHGISCMDYQKKEKKLAILRSDSTIEIWNISHTPHVERTIHNRTGSGVESVCWYNKRLFSVSLAGLLLEYDLQTLKEKYSIPIIGAAGWCMDVHKTKSNLIIGTEQGYLNLYKITNEGVEYEKLLDKQEGRILCLKFNKSGNSVVSGSVDAIRIWNINSGHAVHKMNVSRLTHSTETVVWCLAITDDFTIISGDSRGHLTFWDGEMGSQIESYKTHNAAVLSLCMSDDQKSVYCAGVDPIIMSFVKINIKDDNYKWVKSIQRKIHDHDVRSMLLVKNKLYSGGVDGYLACSYYPPKTLIKYPPMLQNPCISVAKDGRLLLLRYQHYLEVWQLGKESDDEQQVGLLQLEEEPKKLLLLQTKGDEATVCAAISNDGRWIAYSTKTKLRLFNVDYNNDDEDSQIVNYNIPEECTPCFRMEFTPDGSQLVLAPQEGGLQFLLIEDKQLFVSKNIDTSSYLKDIITFLIISPCGKYLVVADPISNITSWKFDENWKFNCTLPKYSCSPTALNIQPKTNNLVIVYADHKIVEYDLVKKQFTDFSRGLDSKTPQQWLNRSFPVSNITFDPKAEHILLFHDDSTICVINKNKKLSKSDAKIPRIDSSSSSQDSGKVFKHAFHIVKKSKHLAYFGWIGDGEMVSVEVSPLSLMETLPPAFDMKLFGTK